jgi:hypothetical protein
MLAGVAGCCAPGEYRRLFGDRQAARDLTRYRRRGVTGTSRSMHRVICC